MAPTPMPGIQPVNPMMAQYLALVDAIGLGAKVIRFQDRTVEYATVDEMIKAANYLYLRMAANGVVPGGARSIRTFTNKGL